MLFFGHDSRRVANYHVCVFDVYRAGLALPPLAWAGRKGDLFLTLAHAVATAGPALNTLIVDFPQQAEQVTLSR
jgi:hypothetical protein